MALDVETLEGRSIWFRQVPAGADPHSTPAEPSDSRWQRASIVGALYLADSEETAWAEWYRALAAAAVPPNRLLPRDLWRWEVDLRGVVDLGGRDLLRRAGLTQPRPDEREWPAFQRVGERLWRAGYRGLVAPSAARPEGRIACIFRGRLEAEPHLGGCDPLPPPRTVHEPPVVPRGLRT